MELIIAPDPKLRIKTKPVKKITPRLLETFKQMIKLTKSFIDPEGVGLASTQAGVDEQFFVAKSQNGKFKICINPKVLAKSKKSKLMLEGCLSIPKFWGQIKRPVSIDASYMDETGRMHNEKLTGLDAQIFQHECDHLQGKLFMDHVLEQKARLFKVVGRDRAGGEVFEEVAL